MSKWYHDKGFEEEATVYKLLSEGAAQIAVQALAMQISQLFNPTQGTTLPGAEGMPGVTAEAGRIGAEPATDMGNSIRGEMG